MKYIQGLECHRQTVDYTAQKFKDWTALSPDVDNWQPKHRRWICQCKCSSLKSISSSTIGHAVRATKYDSCAYNCGCDTPARPLAKDLTHQIFGTRRVTGWSHKDNLGMHYWSYVCQCGNTGKVSTQNLKRTQTCKSCHSNYSLLFGVSSEQMRNPDLPKHLYLCCHPERKGEYKIGIAKDPYYRTQPTHGGLILLDSVETTQRKALEVERDILLETLPWAFRPDDCRDGHTEWRRGEDVVRIWHEKARAVR